MKKEYVSPSVIVEMFSVDTVILLGISGNQIDEEGGDDNDRAQIRRNQDRDSYRTPPTFRDKGFGSLW